MKRPYNSGNLRDGGHFAYLEMLMSGENIPRKMRAMAHRSSAHYPLFAAAQLAGQLVRYRDDLVLEEDHELAGILATLRHLARTRMMQFDQTRISMSDWVVQQAYALYQEERAACTSPAQMYGIYGVPIPDEYLPVKSCKVCQITDECRDASRKLEKVGTEWYCGLHAKEPKALLEKAEKLKKQGQILGRHMGLSDE